MLLGCAVGAFAQDARLAPAAVLGVRRDRTEFLAGRQVRGGGSPARAFAAARREHLRMMAARPEAANLTQAWSPVGPSTVLNPVYGEVSGRVTAVAIDPDDATGNTVYLGTTGGGVWKSTNAAGPAGSVTFSPLTDALPVFDLSGGSGVTPSLSIGALAIGGGVLLAGTGDPNDATDSYYGGGILRSADSGLTWTLAVESADGLSMNRSFVGLSVAGIAFSSANPQVVVAALGQSVEGELVNAGFVADELAGLYVSNDGGRTWQVATVMDGNQTVQNAFNGAANNGGNGATSVVWNPVRQQFFAALSGHGYYASSDGANWTRLTNQPGTGINLTNCPTLSAVDAACPVFRGALAVQPATGDMYALSVDVNDGDQGLYEDKCGLTAGACSSATVLFGTKLNSAPLEVGGGSTEIEQGTYNLALAAVPSGTDTLLYVGTVDLYRCDVGQGCALRDTTNAENGCATPAGVAGAQHAIAAAGTLIYLGNDGGIWRSTDGVAETGGVCSASDASHFQNLNGAFGPNGSLAEVVSFAEDPVSPATLLAGLGALGSAGTGSGTGAWAQMSTGEGGTVAIDPAAPLNWYVSTGAEVNIGRCAKGSGCGMADFAATAIGSAQTDSDPAEWHAPWLLDPGLTSQLLAGTCRVWRGPATGGSAWTPADLLSAPFAAPLATGCGGGSSPLGEVRSLGAGGPVSGLGNAPVAGSEALYAGMAGVLDGGGSYGGHLFATASAQTSGANTAWTDAALNPVTNDASDNHVFNPAGFDLSSIAVDAHDATGATAYATVMGFAGNGFNSPHVYRTVSGGASWTNITSNLPNAPANSVVVDPNDANTVYVALDTGVYVTTAVSTCPAANCWDVYGLGLPNSPVTQLAAASGMATGDGRLGVLRAATYGRGIWSIPLATAITPAAPAISLNPASLAFGNQQVGTGSTPKSITVTNTGTVALTVASVAATGDFGATSSCVGSTVAVQGTCTVSVTFSPTATGARTGILTVYGNVPGGQATAALSGNGTAPASIQLSPTSIAFPATPVGAVSAAANITVSNLGGNASAISSISVAGPFTISANGCGSTLGPGTGCTVAIECAPTASGALTGALTVVDSQGTQVANLSCTGQQPATDTLSPLSLSFAPQQIATASPAQTVTLTNSGDVALTSISDQIAGEFSAVNGCGATLSGHASCSFSVTCVPTSVGAGSGTLTVTDALRSQTVALSCTGLASAGVSLTPAAGLSFAATALGQTSAPQTVTLTNNGGAALSIQQILVSGDFTQQGSSSCGPSLAAGASCTIPVGFTPTAGGNRTGTLSVTDNTAGSPQSVPLTGVGVDFALNPGGTTTQTISSGQTATYQLLLTAAAGVPGSAVFTCSGIPKYTICTVTPSPATLYSQNGTVITVTIETGQATGALELHPLGWKGQTVWLAMFVPLGWAARRRRRLPCVLLGAVLLFAGGCATRTIPAGGGGGGGGVVTPSGTSTIIVAGSSAGLVRSVNLTLVVQ